MSRRHCTCLSSPIELAWGGWGIAFGGSERQLEGEEFRAGPDNPRLQFRLRRTTRSDLIGVLAR
jgi:hypothetical protein